MFKHCLAFILFSLTCEFAYSQSYSVQTISGDSAGYVNGLKSGALFNSPTGITTDNSGNLYVADTYNNVIRVLWNSFNLTGTLAGNGTAGFNDGTATAAEFNNPIGVCVDKLGNVYVADMNNNRIRKISTNGTVSTLAGNGITGHKDTAVAASAEFNLPTGLTIDTAGDIFVADAGNYDIREISASGVVTTIAGTGYAGFKNGSIDSAKFYGLFGIAVNKAGTTVYVSEYINNDIRSITGGVVSMYAGYGFGADTGMYEGPTPSGIRDGGLDSALFDGPLGIYLDTADNIYLCDELNNRIRFASINRGTVVDFVGSGAEGFMDASQASDAELNQPFGITMYKGTFYFTDNGNNRIRAVIPPVGLGIPSVSQDNASMLVYPNPCTNKLTIASAPAGAAQLMDVTGREVWSNPTIKAPFTLSTMGLAPGIYFLRISSATTTATTKVVIEH